jgi:hypothetical protein
MSAKRYVSTIARVVRLLGEDEELLHDVAEGMEPEDGYLTILDGENESTVAFTPQSIETLNGILADLKR